MFTPISNLPKKNQTVISHVSHVKHTKTITKKSSSSSPSSSAAFSNWIRKSYSFVIIVLHPPILIINTFGINMFSHFDKRPIISSFSYSVGSSHLLHLLSVFMCIQHIHYIIIDIYLFFYRNKIKIYLIMLSLLLILYLFLQTDDLKLSLSPITMNE